MKVAVVGAYGNVGQRLVKELRSRGHEVTALGRNVGALAGTEGVTEVKVDANNQAELAQALKGHDIAISSLRFSESDPETLIAAAKEAGVQRYFVVGGAASLTAPGTDQKIIDSGQIPEQFMPEIRAGANFLDRLKQEPEGLDWTFVSPSMLFTAGERTGKFREGKDELLVGEDGKSWISYEDFSVSLADEIEKGQHRRSRYTVGY